MSETEIPERWRLAEAIHEARIKLAWGSAWEGRKQKWPRTAKDLRSYAHSPVAEMDLVLAEADTAIAFFAANAVRPLKATDGTQP